MLTKNQAEEILRALIALPSEKVIAVQDFIQFLKDRCKHEQPVDESGFWTEEDLHDLTVAVSSRADRTIQAEVKQ